MKWFSELPKISCFCIYWLIPWQSCRAARCNSPILVIDNWHKQSIATFACQLFVRRFSQVCNVCEISWSESMVALLLNLSSHWRLNVNWAAVSPYKFAGKVYLSNINHSDWRNPIKTQPSVRTLVLLITHGIVMRFKIAD